VPKALIPEHPFKTLLTGYVNERIPLSAVREWLINHVQDVADAADAGDVETQRMTDITWILISELDRRDRHEASIRDELQMFELSQLLHPSS